MVKRKYKIDALFYKWQLSFFLLLSTAMKYTTVVEN